MSLAERLKLDKDPIFLIDGTSFLYRAFYAYPDLKRSDGFPTNALFIVLRLLLRLKREENPEHAGFFMDGPGPTFRHERFAAYKSQRQKTPEDLVRQVEPLLRGARLMGFNAVLSDGVEADDLIASACARFKDRRPVVIMGSDKDLLQCLDTGVFLWDPAQKNEKVVSLQSFQEEFSLRPEQWPDFQALVGDSSDNIPGVPGVGPKTARELMLRFPTLESLREGLARLSPRQRTMIEPCLEDVFLYRELARLRTDLTRERNLSEFRCRPMDAIALRRFFEEFEFRSLARDVAPALQRRTLDVAVGEGSRTGSGQHAAPQADPEPFSALPDFTGQRVAVLPEREGWRVAYDGREGLWPASGDTAAGPAAAALAGALGAASMVAALSWKNLLHAAPVWTEVPMDRRFDVGLAAYLLQPEERDYGLGSLTRAFHHDLQAGPGRTKQSGPGLILLALAGILEQKTTQAGFRDLLVNLEMPLVPVLVDMEKAGVMLDKAALDAFLDEVRRDLERIGGSVFEHAGGPFNLRSSQQTAEVLFQRLGLKTGRKTPGGGRPTNSEVLAKLSSAHPIVPEILEYRKLEKLRSTYLEPLPRLTDPAGRLHTTFNQLAVATGRLSSSNPNLQNIPIRGPQGRRMRACFTASKGHHLISADYSQIELRILAHLSEDPHLLDLFARGVDIHEGTAAILFTKDPDQVEADERRKAKTINFGLLYGMGPQKLARELGISLREAKDFILLYFSRLSKVRAFYDRVVEGAREHGAVFTLSGRRRLLPDIHSRNENLAQTARRMAINTVVQGSAADVIKMAMISVHRDEQLRRLKAGMILQVHDELVLEAPVSAAREAGARTAELMSTVTALKVPLTVDWGAGANWAEAHE